jgi:hypothetical protein
MDDEAVTGRIARFDPDPTTEARYRVSRQHLRRAFTRWSTATGCPFGPDSFEELVHYKWGYLDGHLTRWRCADLDEVLLELFPAKVIVGKDDLKDVVPEAQAFISFLADTGILDPDSDEPDKMRLHLSQVERRFVRRMADRRRYSWGKRFWLSAAEAGVDPGDKRAVAANIENFNARPQAERNAIIELGRSAGQRRGRFTPPGTGSQPPRSPGQRGRRR